MILQTQGAWLAWNNVWNCGSYSERFRVRTWSSRREGMCTFDAPNITILLYCWFLSLDPLELVSLVFGLCLLNSWGLFVCSKCREAAKKLCEDGEAHSFQDFDSSAQEMSYQSTMLTFLFDSSLFLVGCPPKLWIVVQGLNICYSAHLQTSSIFSCSSTILVRNPLTYMEVLRSPVTWKAGFRPWILMH